MPTWATSENRENENCEKKKKKKVVLSMDLT